MQNILEAQASELGNLVDSPIAISIAGTGGSQNSTPFAMPPTPQQNMMGEGMRRDSTSTDRGHTRDLEVGMRGPLAGEGRNGSIANSREGGGGGQERDVEQGGGGGQGHKRKNDGDRGSGEGRGGTNSGSSQNGQNVQPRAKRNRYISIACNECKRRKIKCNGQSPCQRCGNLNLTCQYAPNCCSGAPPFQQSDDYRRMNEHLASLQCQLESLYAQMQEMRMQQQQQSSINGTPTGHIGARTSEGVSPGMQKRVQKSTPKFQGPTSNAFGFSVAKNTLQNMGYTPTGQDEDTDTPMGSPPQRSQGAGLRSDWRDRDPLYALDRQEAVRLCGVYAEEVGSMYPFLDMEGVVGGCERWYSSIESQQTSRQLQHQGRNPPPLPTTDVSESDINILKLVLAIATVVEGSGQSDFGTSLYNTVKAAVDHTLHSRSFSISDIPLIVLIATYHFHCDEEALAWRVIGQASRMCVELGLHRSDSLFKNFPAQADRAQAMCIFWSIYCLDRRWSFGTGMPFAIQDSDIDSSLPGPEVEGPGTLPYLNSMIEYSRIGSRVWRSVAGSDGRDSEVEIKKEDVEYLDYKVLQWQKSIPPDLQLPPPGGQVPNSRALHRLQVILYLRCNQMRILIHRPVLHSSTSILSNLSYSRTVVNLAKDTIHHLTTLNRTTDIYRAQQVCFNYFLISALAVLFLASCHAPVEFSAACKAEFYDALELVKGFEGRSYVSKRLWRAIRGLKEVGPRLGLEQDNGQAEHETALAMAGLAQGHNGGMDMHGGAGMNEGFGGMGNGNGNSPPINGFQMSTEMTNLFEAALGAGTGLHGGYGPEGVDGGQMQGQMMQGGGGGIFGGEDELYRQLRDLF